ncbi:MAG: flippase [Dehalococcoidia bacterium]|jgi:O-antigen/teichoic acid export membrane protein
MMNTVQRIAKNAAVLISAQLIGFVISFFYVMYAARYLGPESFGVLSFAIAFTGLFSFVADFGLQPLTVREVSRNKSLAPKYLVNNAVIKVFLVISYFGLMALIVNAMDYPDETITVVYLFAFYAILQSLNQMFYAMFQSFERMGYQAIGQVLNSALILAGVMLAIKYGLGVVGFAWLYCAAGFVVLLYSFVVFVWKFTKPPSQWLPWNISIKWEFWKRTLRAALPFTLTIAIAGIFLRIDVIMISAIKGDTAAGYYNAACNLIMVLLVTAGISMSTVFPAMSRFFVTSRDSLKLAMEKSAKYMFIIGLPIAVGTFLLADRIIIAIYGINYDQTAIVLRILILYIPISFICQSIGPTLASINKEPLRTLSVGITVLANIALNFILIPRYGIQGAGVSTVISQVLLLLLVVYFAGKNFYWLPLHKIVIKPFIACTAMGALIYFIREESLFLIIPTAAILYFVLLLILKTFDTRDIKVFKDVIRGVSKLLPSRLPRI